MMTDFPSIEDVESGNLPLFHKSRKNCCNGDDGPTNQNEQQNGLAKVCCTHKVTYTL